jgi:Tol biopolymer transport system component
MTSKTFHLFPHRGRVALLLAALTASALAPPARAVATPPGVNGVIAFARLNMGGIDMVNPDGTGLIQFRLKAPTCLIPYADPSWAPGGRRLLFLTGCKFGWDVIISNLNGWHVRDLTPRIGEQSVPTMSPNGKTIVFNQASPGGTDTHLWLMNSDGTNPRQLTNGPGYEFDGAWSPDGTHLAFLWLTDTGCHAWTMRADGTQKHRLTASAASECPARPALGDTGPDWSPDGHSIVFESNRTGTFQLYIKQLDTGTVRQLTHATGGADSPSWSPDGTMIVFDSYDPTSGAPNLYTIATDGTHLRQITTIGATEPSWQRLPSDSSQ